MPVSGIQKNPPDILANFRPARLERSDESDALLDKPLFKTLNLGRFPTPLYPLESNEQFPLPRIASCLCFKGWTTI